MPGVEDIIGEYRCGEAVSVTVTFSAADGAGTTAHVPASHPQLPAPQSSGPSQLMLQAFAVQSGAALFSVHAAGWQHCAGTQSAAAVQT
jgi:hypothetical protein